jgi:hypothetical protein
MGLPPGPIAIPSRAAIEAAKAPMETDDVFFVATGEGGHNFSRTLQEHNRNVGAYRAKVAGQASAKAKAQAPAKAQAASTPAKHQAKRQTRPARPKKK